MEEQKSVVTIFRLYDAPEGGNLLWEESWIAPDNQVTVTEGLFNVALGRLEPIQDSVLNRDALYLGISIDGDPEASPREQLTMVPYSWSANTVSDGAITTAKIADNTITEADIIDNFKARDADKLDGNNSSDFAGSEHRHDGRYYTESESDNRFSRSGHAHDGRYYTEGESNNRFVNTSGDSMSGNLNLGGNRI